MQWATLYLLENHEFKVDQLIQQMQRCIGRRVGMIVDAKPRDITIVMLKLLLFNYSGSCVASSCAFCEEFSPVLDDWTDWTFGN